MSEQAKAIMSTIVIVACLALLGVMVYLRVDGAAIGALGTITAIVAWLSRTPDRRDPPPGATAIPLFVAGALLASILACGCSAQAKQEEARDTYAAQQMVCVEKYRDKEFKTVAEMDACRVAVKDAWGRDAGAKDGAK